MAHFSQETIKRFEDMGENNIVVERPFLVDRISISVTEGTANYVIPDYIKSIRRITFKGKKVSPLSARQHREFFNPVQSHGWPFWYIYNNIGTNTIKFFPTPDQSAPTVVNVWDTDIPTGCIIEFYRVPGIRYITDSGNLWGSSFWGGGGLTGDTQVVFQLPPYVRRQLLKQFIAFKVAEVEGGKQNQKIAKYFAGRWGTQKAEFISLMNELHNKSRKLVVSGVQNNLSYPGTPILPVNKYGVYVEEGM